MNYEQLKEMGESVKKTAGLVGKLSGNDAEIVKAARYDQAQLFYRSVVDNLLGVGNGLDPALRSSQLEELRSLKDPEVPVSGKVVENVGSLIEMKLREYVLRNYEDKHLNEVYDMDLIKDRSLTRVKFDAGNIYRFLEKKIHMSKYLAQEILERAYNVGNFHTPEQLNCFDIEIPEELDFDRLRREITKDKALYLCRTYHEGLKAKTVSVIRVDDDGVETGETTFGWDELDESDMKRIARNINSLRGKRELHLVYDQLPDRRAGGAVNTFHAETPIELLPTDHLEQFLEKYPELR